MNETAITPYRMNPAEDYLAFTDELTVGMQVMKEDPQARCSAMASEDEQIRANRFARIVKMRQAEDPSTTILILEWIDGFQRKVNTGRNGAWIVKREGIPSAESELREITGEEG